MSIIMGALGGLGEGAAQWAQQGIRHDQDVALEKLRSENAANKAMQLAKFSSTMKIDEANKEREGRVGRVNAALGDANTGIIGSAIKSKYASPVMGDTPLTAEQQAVLDEGLAAQAKSKSEDVDVLKNDPMTRLKAQVATGDTDATVAAGLQSKSDIQAAKSEAYRDVQSAKTDAYLQVQAAKTDATNAKTQAQYEAAMAKMEGAIAKAGSGNTDFDKKINLLKESGASPSDIAEFITQRKQPSIEDIATGLMKADKMAGSPMAMTPEAAIEKAKKLRSLGASLSEPAKNAKPAPGKDERPAPKYKDGDLLKGPGGHTYIVKNGLPVKQ